MHTTDSLLDVFNTQLSGSKPVPLKQNDTDMNIPDKSISNVKSFTIIDETSELSGKCNSTNVSDNTMKSIKKTSDSKKAEQYDGIDPTKYVTLLGLYGDKSTGRVLEDPRIARPNSIARFELFWAWSTQYYPMSKIMLLDAKDTYFQRHPFIDLERDEEDYVKDHTGEDDRVSGELHLYEVCIDYELIRLELKLDVLNISSFQTHSAWPRPSVLTAFLR